MFTDIAFFSTVYKMIRMISSLFQKSIAPIDELSMKCLACNIMLKVTSTGASIDVVHVELFMWHPG